MKDFNTDVLIIGSGIAGLSAAIKLAEENLKVTIVTREKKPEITNTYWAQGGIIYSPESLNDQEDLINDIIKASSYTSNEEAAKILSSRSAEIIEEMLIRKSHTDFAKNAEGTLLFTKEAAHSRDRIIYKGDMTGKAIQISLLNYLNDSKRFPNVSFLTSHTAIDLITPNHHGVDITQRYEENQVLGAYIFDQAESLVRKVLSKVTILTLEELELFISIIQMQKVPEVMGTPWHIEQGLRSAIWNSFNFIPLLFMIALLIAAFSFQKP